MFGGPGSGKTTQSQKMVTVYQFVHVSLSEQLKDPRRSKQLTEIMESDDLELIKESLLKGLQHSKTCNGFVIDGYPNDKTQAINFERHIGTADLIMYLKCDDWTMKNRVGFRAKAADEYEDEDLTKEHICDFKKNRDEILKLYEHKVITVKKNISLEGSPIFSPIFSGNFIRGLSLLGKIFTKTYYIVRK